MSTYAVINPATGETVREYSTAESADIENAVSAAAAAFETPRETPVVERAALLNRARG